MLWFYIVIFLVSSALLYFAGGWVMGGLMRIARFLGWKEFVVAFFIMAFAASLPNFFLGITSALMGVPQLSFGDIAGNNLVALTLAVGLAVLIGKKELPAESKTVQTTSIFTIMAAILPLILILDGNLSRIDGVLLISLFIFYSIWLFSKKERFTKIYDTHKTPLLKEFKVFLVDLTKLILGIVFILVAAQGIVVSAQFFAISFNLSLILIGLLVTGLGNALPEIYFGIVSARKGEVWMILGNLMGAVIVPATLVLGMVALIHPITNVDFSSFAVARFFLFVAAISFLVFTRTHGKVTRQEGIYLMAIYLAFVATELLLK